MAATAHVLLVFGGVLFGALRVTLPKGGSLLAAAFGDSRCNASTGQLPANLKLNHREKRCPDSESLSLPPIGQIHSAVSVLPETSEEPGPVTSNDGLES